MHIQLSKVQGLNVIQEKMTIFNHLSTLDYFNFIFLIFVQTKLVDILSSC